VVFKENGIDSPEYSAIDKGFRSFFTYYKGNVGGYPNIQKEGKMMRTTIIVATLLFLTALVAGPVLAQENIIYPAKGQSPGRRHG
jgi:hypothetical protein